jgi:hypothetical protein
MKELTEKQHRLLETLNSLTWISSKEAKALLEFAQENIDPNITCCLTCGDQVRRLVRRITNWWDHQNRIDMIWDIEEADIQELEKQEVPNDVMTCEHCGKETIRRYYDRWHGDKCRQNPDNNE